MGFLSAYDGVKRVDLGRGYWVDLVLHISQGSKEAAERAASKVKVSRGMTDVEPDVVAFRQLMILGHIKEWNLDDDNGQVWPINITSVKRLPGDVFEEIWVVVNELTKPRSQEDRKRFPGADDEGTEGGSGAGSAAYVPDGTAVLAEDRGEPEDASPSPGSGS
jgi:hypothetical protein